MKIYSNPQFPRIPPQTRDPLIRERLESRDLRPFLAELAARNERELRLLREKRERGEKKEPLRESPTARKPSRGTKNPPPHSHRVTGQVRSVQLGGISHSHRFRGVTGEAIATSEGHVHALRADTDVWGGHLHSIQLKTGPPIPIGTGARHTHLMEGSTSTDRPLNAEGLQVRIAEVAD